jgi:hypothetical protein
VSLGKGGEEAIKRGKHKIIQRYASIHFVFNRCHILCFTGLLCTEVGAFVRKDRLAPEDHNGKRPVTTPLRSGEQIPYDAEGAVPLFVHPYGKYSRRIAEILDDGL